ncbi:PEPxxWA-CTERM sorting domain-containing protein [Sandarakinorhabdus sp. AAP62]|uniref:PEPxxWA-CTERM sorting domain-containing protein n=1 Tax=Sandarakinorhabdus sp. AAP62 TaxID=1248916 RepID=UPI000312A057|nr:PEPxxWA-CTERM sorting domain-containing protein [Sandarakinorhabdus sp. AAP62]
MGNFLKSAIAAVALAAMPMAAQATTTVSIVSFTANQAGPNLTYTDNGAAGWTLSTVTPKNVLVTLEDFGGGFVSGVAAQMTFSGTGTSFAQNTTGNLWSQAFTGGTVSFTSAAAFSIGSTVYAAGSNILTLSFTGGELSAVVPGSSGNALVSIPGDGFANVTSDYLPFPPVQLTDFSISLANVVPGFVIGSGGLGTQSNARFTDFVARGSGDFTATVPEPGTWLMLLTGFGMVGFAARRRQTAVAA